MKIKDKYLDILTFLKSRLFLFLFAFGVLFGLTFNSFAMEYTLSNGTFFYYYDDTSLQYLYDKTEGRSITVECDSNVIYIPILNSENGVLYVEAFSNEPFVIKEIFERVTALNGSSVSTRDLTSTETSTGLYHRSVIADPVFSTSGAYTEVVFPYKYITVDNSFVWSVFYENIANEIDTILISSDTSMNTTTFDSGFYLLDFKASSFSYDSFLEATWSGTSKDSEKMFFDDYYIKLKPMYVTDLAGVQTPELKVHDFTNDKIQISDLKFSKLLSDFDYQGSDDDDYRLSKLQVTPFYERDGKIYHGQSILISFDKNGVVGDVGDAGEVTQGTFYLTGVKVRNTSILGGNDITWTGTSDPSIKELDVDDATIDVYFYGVDSGGNEQKFEGHLLDPDLSVITIYSSLGLVDVANGFDVDDELIKYKMSQSGYTFNGKIELSPVYVTDAPYFRIVRGTSSFVDFYNGEVKIGDDIVTPPDTGGTGGSDDFGLPDIGGIGDIITYLLEIFSGLFAMVGNLPVLLSGLFSFVPSGIIGLISLAIMVCIVLRILGR